MTDQEFQQLKFEVDNLKSRFEQQNGKDPQALHPHGNRQPEKAPDNEMERRVTVLENFIGALRGEKGIEVNKNVIRLVDPPPPIPPRTITANVCDETTGVKTPQNFVVYP